MVLQFRARTKFLAASLARLTLKLRGSIGVRATGRVTVTVTAMITVANRLGFGLGSGLPGHQGAHLHPLVAHLHSPQVAQPG